MPEELGSKGLIRIKNENDRNMVAAILYKNDYTVRPVRAKRNGKTYDYYVEYSLRSQAPEETEADE